MIRNGRVVTGMACCVGLLIGAVIQASGIAIPPLLLWGMLALGGALWIWASWPGKR